ncbi:MAG: hypothetical protein LBQ47_03790 [Endomicrobium sp.]|jgi:hypothetical protein|nr:hypothetical protein [Endomicrobium sp.]
MSFTLPEIARSKWAVFNDDDDAYFFTIKPNAPEKIKQEYEKWKKEMEELEKAGIV